MVKLLRSAPRRVIVKPQALKLPRLTGEDVEVLRACERARRSQLVLTSASLAAALGKRSTRAAPALRAMCANGTLLRIGRGKYVVNRLSPAARAAAAPTRIFPWWGSKQRALNVLVSVLLEETARNKCSAVVSPFAGSGIVEGTLRNLGVPVQAFDLDANIVNMHKALTTAARRREVACEFQAEVSRLRRRSQATRPGCFKRTLRDPVLQSQCVSGDAATAVRWNIAMRCSFNGMLRRGATFIPQNLQTLRVAHVCRAFFQHRGVGMCCARRDVFDVLRKAPSDALLFLDPPYLLETAECQYQAGDFGLQKHSDLARELRGRNFVLCHRDDAKIRKLYAPWCEIVTLRRIMRINRAGKSGAEILVIGRRE